MKQFFGTLVTSKNRYLSVLSITVLGVVVLLSSALPASAASRGLETTCSFLTATRLKCSFPVLTPTFNAEIHYATVQCSSTGAAFNIQQFQIEATPPNGTSSIPYQVAGNRASVSGVANAGAIVDIHVQLNTLVDALIDLAPAPGGTTQCTASISASL